MNKNYSLCPFVCDSVGGPQEVPYLRNVGQEVCPVPIVTLGPHTCRPRSEQGFDHELNMCARYTLYSHTPPPRSHRRACHHIDQLLADD